MREAFEKWVLERCKFHNPIERINGYYAVIQTHIAWEAWRVAWLAINDKTLK